MTHNTFYFLVILLIISVTNAQICKSSRNESGSCVKITLCDGMLKILQNKPISPENVMYLLKSQCGSEERTPKVCCPLESSLFKDAMTLDNNGFGIMEEDLMKHMENKTQTRANVFKVTHRRAAVLPRSSECGIQTFNRRIVGGEQTYPGEFPWSTILLYNDSKILCGGTLISKRYVLTAAHCIRQDLRAVRLGEYDTASDGKDCIGSGDDQTCSGPSIDVPIEQITVHPEYTAANAWHDIALLRLAKNVAFKDYINPICLPTTTIELAGKFSSPEFIVAGWGKTEDGFRSNLLLKLRVREYSFDKCGEVYGNLTYRTSNVMLQNGQICAGGVLNEDSCKGDSGAALMAVSLRRDGLHWVSAGIVSFGTTRCGLGKPGVYTKVSNYIGWIQKEIKP